MEKLEHSFLNVLLLTHGVTEKIHKKLVRTELSVDKFAEMYPSYSDLNQVMYHSEILQARKLWEANHRYNLTDKEWEKLLNLDMKYLTLIIRVVKHSKL